MIAQLENRHLTDAAKYQEVTRGLEAALAENKRNVAYMEPEVRHIWSHLIYVAYRSILQPSRSLAFTKKMRT